MSCFPRFTVRHTSARHSGQVYIPEINFALMAGCLIVVAVFQSATKIGNAYGLAIITVMLLDTCLLALVMLLAWEWPTLVVSAFWLFFTFISAAYFSSNLEKVPTGAWFALMLAGILSIVSFVYYYGQTKKAQYIQSHAVELEDLFEAAPNDGDKAVDMVWRSMERHSAQSGVTIATNSTKSGASAAVALHPGLQRLRLVGTKLPVSRLPGIGIYFSELLTGTH